MTAPHRKQTAAPVHLLEAEAVPGARARVKGALWDGVLNATPDDDIDGPSPIEARRLVELALRDGTITRTPARGLELTIFLTIIDTPGEVLHVA